MQRRLSDPGPPGQPTRWSRLVAGLAHGGLLFGLPAVGGLAGALLAAPLLLAVRGLWLGRPYTYAWCSLLIVFYIGAFLAEAWAQPARAPVAIALALVATVEFCALLFYVRFRAVERRRAAS
jgi:uncharacterized membrane protein